MTRTKPDQQLEAEGYTLIKEYKVSDEIGDHYTIQYYRPKNREVDVVKRVLDEWICISKNENFRRILAEKIILALKAENIL